MKKPYQNEQTLAIHAGETVDRFYGAVTLPIFQTSTYLATGKEAYSDIRYLRLNNSPNHLALHEKIAALEGAEAALVTASGMASISTVLLSVLKTGDHLLTQNCLYGGTFGLLQDDAESLGWSYDFVDGHTPSHWEKSLRPNTRAIYFEALTNPLVQVGDLEAVVAFARKHKLVSIIDATFASPCGLKPIQLGFDIVVQSCTKYMNGHSDIVAGSVAASREWISRINSKLIHFGACLDPHACFLLDRGLKTLPARMRIHNENTLALAKFLEAHPMVARVHYPSLESHPDHARAKKLLKGGAGGVLSFELKAGIEESEAMLRRLNLPVFAPSLGGVETLVTIPSLSTHSAIPRAERLRMGIQDNLVRVAVGIEASDDLIADFAQALSGMAR